MRRAYPGRTAAGAVALLAAVALPVGCAESRPPPDVIIVLADTLRADRLGAYGNRRGLTPFLDSFAERAYVFHNAYSQAPWTAPSVASLFTSRFAGQLGIVSFGSVLQEQETTLAEALHDHATAAFLAHWFLAGHGLEQGFDVFEQYFGQPKTRAPSLDQHVFDWLDELPENGRRPIFLYLHYPEPHTPYTPPAEAFGRVLGSGSRPDLDAVNGMLVDPNKAVVGGLPADQLRQVTDTYDTEVASLDRSLNALFVGLAAANMLANAVVVFTADHGQSFQEHGIVGHGNSLFNELLHVPLMIRVPGMSARVDVDEQVQLIDVAPTMLDLAGIPSPHTFEGRTLERTMLRARASWLGPLRVLWPGPADAERPVFSERAAPRFMKAAFPQHEFAILMGTEKYIAGPVGSGHAGEFYDLGADPEEQRPNTLSSADRARLRRALDVLTSHVNQSAAAPTNVPLDAETRERMRALGYGDE